MCASTASRVVPGISVTSARSAPSSALKSDDLPGVGPAGEHQQRALPQPLGRGRGREQPLDLRPRTSSSCAGDPRGRHGPVVLPGKVDVVGRAAPAASTSDSRSSASRRERPPSSWRSAARACAGAVASIRSPTASACTRSSLPLSTARRVNSPGAAGRAPAAWSAASSRVGREQAAVAGELDQVLAGVAVRARGRRCRAPRSIGSPAASRKVARVAARGGRRGSRRPPARRPRRRRRRSGGRRRGRSGPAGWRARRWGRRACRN